MPCSCWYNPPEASLRLIKGCCQQIVDEIKRLEKEGDPNGVSLEKAQELLEHLYYPERCKEKSDNTNL